MHGGDVAGYRERYGREPVDLSVNISPLGMPEGVLRAVRRAASEPAGYPDGSCRRLRRALAGKYGVSEEDIFCSGGAADIIFRVALVYRGKRALVVCPAFTEYERSLRLFDCDARTYCLDEKNDFLMTEEDADLIAEEVGQGIDVLFIGQPGNPSGRVADIPVLERIADACDRQGTLLAVDECFIEFAEGYERFSLLGKLQEHRLILIRSFTKLYAMAGLRIGYCLFGREAPAEAIREAGQPWPVSNIAEAAALAALREERYADEVRKATALQREYLKRELELLGCRVIPSDVNYLLFYHRDHELHEKLALRGILIRECSDQTGLGRGWYRAAAADDGSVKEFINALSFILKEDHK